MANVLFLTITAPIAALTEPQEFGRWARESPKRTCPLQRRGGIAFTTGELMPPR